MEACSYRYHKNVEMLSGNRQTVLLQGLDITPNGFLDVLDGIFLSFALADTSREAGTFSNPIAIFPRIKNYLPHIFLLNPADNFRKD
jgi:hypothetical protein